MEITTQNIIDASKEKDVATFMKYLFPVEWYPVISRIVESGVQFDEDMCLWAPRWSNIPWTVKKSENELRAAMKTCLYRIHDCFHQLWGLPIPHNNFSTSDYYSFKRAQMCGEVAVLTLSEFILCKSIYDRSEKGGEIQNILYSRMAVPMMEGPLKDKTPVEIAMRLDTILHKKKVPFWARQHEPSSKWASYYIPMLEADRVGIDNNWKAMVDNNWIPADAPNSRYSEDLDGLELTIWMIEDFFHLCKTDTKIDYPLAKFNQERRSKVILPKGWK